MVVVFLGFQSTLVKMTKRFFVLLLFFFVVSLRTNRFLKFLSYGQSLVNFGEN